MNCGITTKLKILAEAPVLLCTNKKIINEAQNLTLNLLQSVTLILTQFQNFYLVISV